jgi:ribosome-binding factor A
VSARRREGGRGSPPAGPSQRQLRVGEELRHALVEILRDNHARDPDLRNANVTVTEVRVSPDLVNATAYVMPFGGEHIKTTIAALNRASVYFRMQIAKSVQLRHAPKIFFALDTSFSYAEKIEGLLRDPEVQRDLARDGEESESEDPAVEAGKQD